MDAPDTRSTPEDRYDPVFLHSRREAILIASAWAVGLVWAVPYCYLNGYTVWLRERSGPLSASLLGSFGAS